MKPPEMTVGHVIMSCPVCAKAIRADVTVQPVLGEPTIDVAGNSATIPCATEMTRFSVQHRCQGRVEIVEGKPA
jgi:hypothetical protein